LHPEDQDLAKEKIYKNENENDDIIDIIGILVSVLFSIPS
jgi:hypothetical protein